MEKTWNNKAWFMVVPVLVLVAFSAVIPLMTVVNYSVQDTFGNNQFFWAGTDWFTDILSSDRFWDALGRNLIFSMIILAIQVPLGIFIALNMPKKGFWASFCLVLMALPLLIPFNVVGTIWQIFGRVDIGLLGHTLAAVGIELDSIAAVVIGGTLLTGGYGFIFGTLIGVMLQGLVQTYIVFDGTLSSWWTKIAIGFLLFMFILLQKLVFTAQTGRTRLKKAPA